jgi:hypothetical protein
MRVPPVRMDGGSDSIEKNGAGCNCSVVSMKAPSIYVGGSLPVP